MNIKYSLITIYIIAGFCLAGCSSPSGNSSTPPSAAEISQQEESGLVEDEETGLVAGLNLNDNISDYSDITVSGDIGWIEGLSGLALSLDSDGEFISLPDSDSLDLIGGGTVSVWVNPSVNTSFAGILHKGVETDFSDEAWSLQYWTDDKPAIFLYSESGIRKQITAAEPLTTGTWHHLAATWGDETFRFYVNGNLEGEIALTDFHPIKNSSGDLIIGSQLPAQYNTSYGHLTFIGAIDSILIFNHQLSEEEVLDLYNN